MSLFVSKTVNLPQTAVKFLVQEETENESAKEYRTQGGVLSATDYAWLSCGPRLEIVSTKTGNKMGAWTFGSVLKDSDTEVICVDEIQRPHGSLPLLAVGIDCPFGGGMICVFDFITSRIIRAIQIEQKITSLRVIDAGYDVFTLPGPLRNFDGIIAVGTEGGDVFLIDICRQICDEALTVEGLGEIRDELNPCQLSNITSKDVLRIGFHKEFAIRNSQHLAIHLNVVFDKSTDHFTLKGPKGDDRVHVNKEEVAVSSLCFCSQLGSLLIGYNFGALQLYNLMNLNLEYTSPVCEEHIPISHFAVQEPADDPRAFCYIWAVYSAGDECQGCLPLAVMYAFCYHTKEYHEGYGFLYQDFNYAAVQYQMELALPGHSKRLIKPQGGRCLRLSTMQQSPLHKDKFQADPAEDNLTICVLVWSVWFNRADTETFVAVFDLNQWYKEQMPKTPDYNHCSTYMVQFCVSDVSNAATDKTVPVLDVSVTKNSLNQFQGTQRLEEHFCPNSLSFGLCCLRESDAIFIENHGVQKALLARIKNEGPLCLIEPAEIYQQVVGLGLVPLFVDLPANSPVSTSQQREIILDAALEHQLLGWLCRCASDWANGSFLAAGCSLDFLISWAYQRAATLKSNCDKFCIPLFDYSEMRLDTNTNNLLNNCTRQLSKVCSFYSFIINRLVMFLPNHELVEEQYRQLQMTSVYFEVLQWLLNVGLLPECPLTAYPRSDDFDRVNAPYPAETLIDFYNHRRALLKILNEENFSSSHSVLFIDNLVEKECGGPILQRHWQNDGGNGSYPPPSLQALLRTYLVDHTDMSYKHSLVIYVFLDLAMILDQDRYKTVVTYLIKFPAVFQVSPSVIKITQAFWQLDHGDYNTAIGLLLDPLVLSQDLKDWHHKVTLRSLLLQKQHNFALLYLQIRKPAIVDDEDVFSAISLYVANNMLDEAFYFEKHFSKGPDNTKFMRHLFNEATKDHKLKSLIYRALDPDQEKFFLAYLLDSKQPNDEDLHVYYHILRSRYIEAFESHDRTVPNQVETQGLVGQQHAVPRDKLVYNLKKILPNVNRNLLTLCAREKKHVWKQVVRPTPMSVFTHNVEENACYKSTLIYAALAKAKQTFDDAIGNESKSVTEGTPFLRTPIVPRLIKRLSTTLIDSKIIEDYGPTPSKRLKLSPRPHLTPLTPSRLDTPVVKRKTPRVLSEIKEMNAITPQSILKVRSLMTKETPGKFKDDLGALENISYTPVTSLSKKSGLGLSPRKSLNRSAATVRFEGVGSLSSSLNSNHNLSSGSERTSLTKDVSLLQRSNSSSKNNSTEEDTFYSPETSIEENQVSKGIVTGESYVGVDEIGDERRENEGEAANKSISNVEEWEEEKNDAGREIKGVRFIEDTSVKVDEMKDVSVVVNKTWIKNADNEGIGFVNEREGTHQNQAKVIDNKDISNIEELEENKKYAESHVTTQRPVYTPKARRSYRGSAESVPVRTSPRLSKLSSSISESSSDSPNDSPKTPSSSPKVVPALRGRKSLCRKVLETNALSRVFNSPVDSSRSRQKTEEISTTEETVNVAIESTTKYIDGEDTQKSSLTSKHVVTTTTVVELNDNFANNTSVSSDLNVAQDRSATKSNLDVELFSKSITEILKARDMRATVETEEVPPVMSVETVEKEVAADEKLTEEHSSLEHNQFNSYQETNLSASALEYVTDTEIEENLVVDDVMEVDVYQDLTGDEQTGQVDIYEEISSDDNKDEKELVYEDISHNNRTVDPQMNVFEISDDLSVNDGIAVEKEVSLEENDLCYGHSNTLENVMQESGISSASPSVFERNVFDRSDLQDEIDQDQLETTTVNKTESADEVIEIGSSSDERETTNESSEKTDDSCEAYNFINYGPNESSEDDTSGSSESADEPKVVGRKSRGFFHGDILYVNDASKLDQTVNIEELVESHDSSDDEEVLPTPEYEKSMGLFHGSLLFTSESSSSISDLAEKEPAEAKQEIEEPVKLVTEIEPPVSSAERVQEEPVEEGGEIESVDASTVNQIVQELEEENFRLMIEESNAATETIVELAAEENRKDELSSEENREIDGKITTESRMEEDVMDNSQITEVCMEPTEIEVETVSEVVAEEENYIGENQDGSAAPGSASSNFGASAANALVTEVSNMVENQEGNAPPDGSPLNFETEAVPNAPVVEERNLVGDQTTEKVVDPADGTVPSISFVSKSKVDILETLEFQPKEQGTFGELPQEMKEDTVEVAAPRKRSSSVSSGASVPSNNLPSKLKIDVLDVLEFSLKEQGTLGELPQVIEEDTVEVAAPKNWSSSGSSGASAKNRKKPRQQDEHALTPRRRSTRSSSTPQQPSTEESKSTTKSLGGRTLRTRASSTEVASPVAVPARRTRSVSADEPKPARKRVKKEAIDLPEIVEEPSTSEELVKAKIEEYMGTRRMTRRQIAMLEKSFESGNLDPLDNVTLDPEEKKGSSSNSLESAPVARRLRSASHVSTVSDGSDGTELSKSPSKGAKRGSRKPSVDEISNVSVKSNKSAPPTRKKTSKSLSESEDVPVKARTTRTKAKSVSADVASTSRTTRKKFASSFTALPEIQEDSSNGAKAAPSKRKTRKDSSQK